MKTLVAPLPPDNPLMKRALDSLKTYHEAVDAGAPADVIQQYKNEAEELFQAVSDYYQRSMGRSSGTLY
ncbi:hypothetical protein [Pseudomonas sp. NBRC 111139]|uniref:hypothetical protein n=1 Tax=Pseudomonas sp. NBRC 111139 TaxID=1661054 RepID=UPI0008636BF3|nr:hypothetical protein [Pseudomonas sp. NBRC 111139]